MSDPISHAEMIAAVRRAIFDYDLEDLQGWEARERHGNALRAVLAHLERTQWRPIEEAPFVCGSGADRLLTDGHRHWVACRTYLDGKEGWAADASDKIKPTHFMFLDALPPSPETPR